MANIKWELVSVANDAACKVEYYFQFNRLAIKANRNSGELTCQYNVQAEAHSNLSLSKPITVKFRKPQTDFRIEGQVASLYNRKNWDSIASLVLVTEEDGISVQSANVTSEACRLLDFRTQNTTDRVGRAWALQAFSRESMKTLDQKCEVAVTLTLSSGRVLGPKTFNVKLVQPVLQLDLSARELTMWSSEDQRILTPRFVFNPGAFDITHHEASVFEVFETSSNEKCQQALGLTNPVFSSGAIRLTSHTSQDLSCTYSVRASLPQTYFAYAEVPFTINFVKRPPPAQLNYSLFVQTLTQTVVSDQKHVDLAQLSMMDNLNRRSTLQLRQISVTMNPGCQPWLDQPTFDEATQIVGIRTKQNVSQALDCSVVFQVSGFDPSQTQRVITSQAYNFKVIPQPKPKTAVYMCSSAYSDYTAQVWVDLERKVVSSAYINNKRPDSSGMTSSVGLVMELKKNAATSTSEVIRFDVCQPGVTFSCPDTIARHLKPSVVFDTTQVTIEAFANFDIRMLPPMSWQLKDCSVFSM